MKTTTIHCPKCPSEKVAPIPPNAIRRILFIIYPRKTYLCLECRAHFSRFAIPGWFEGMTNLMKRFNQLTNPFQGTFSLLKAGIAMGALFFCLALFILWQGKKTAVQDDSQPMKISIRQEESTLKSIPKMSEIDSKESVVTQDQAKTQMPAADPKDTGKAASTPPVPAPAPLVGSKAAPPPALTNAKPTQLQPKSDFKPENPISAAPAGRTGIIQLPSPPTHGKESRKLERIVISFAEEVPSLNLQAGGAIQDYRFLVLDKPPRLVIDLIGRWENPGRYLTETVNPILKSVRIWKYENKLRIVGDLQGEQKLNPIFETTADGLMVKLEQSSPKK